MVRGASYSPGMRSLASDLGMDSDQIFIEVFTDSSAARGIAIRRGLGKVRHIAVCQLWLQDKVNEGEIRVSKMKGTENQADIPTKHVTASTLERHLEGMSHCIIGNRHEMMPTTVGMCASMLRHGGTGNRRGNGADHCLVPSRDGEGIPRQAL